MTYKVTHKWKVQNECNTPKSSGFLKNSSSFDFDALNVALNDARLTDLHIHEKQHQLSVINNK